MGKGEIARYEQFLLFPRRFQKTVMLELVFDELEDIFGKVENTGHQGPYSSSIPFTLSLPYKNRAFSLAKLKIPLQDEKTV